MQILVHLHLNKTHFRMKGFALGLALTLRRKATIRYRINKVHTISKMTVPKLINPGNLSLKSRITLQPLREGCLFLGVSMVIMRLHVP